MTEAWSQGERRHRHASCVESRMIGDWAASSKQRSETESSSGWAHFTKKTKGRTQTKPKCRLFSLASVFCLFDLRLSVWCLVRPPNRTEESFIPSNRSILRPETPVHAHVPFPTVAQQSPVVSKAHRHSTTPLLLVTLIPKPVNHACDAVVAVPRCKRECRVWASGECGGGATRGEWRVWRRGCTW